MSNGIGVCRICLATDVRMFTVADTPLQAVYETFINSSLYKDRRPVKACYICYAQLKRSHMLMLTAINTEIALTELLRTSTEITPTSVASIDRRDRQLSTLLCISPIRHTDSTMAEVEVSVKSEPCQDSDVTSREGTQYTASSVQTCFDFVSLPATTADTCPSLEVQVKMEPAEVKTETVSPPDTDRTDTDDTDDDLPLSCVETVMADGKAKKSFPDEKNNRAFENTTENIDKDKTDKTLEYNICERKFKVKGALNEHIRTQSRDKRYQCNLCNYKFTKKINLEIHIRTHTGEKPYQCDVCKKKFSETVNLKRHVRTHTGEKPFECDVCKRRFNEAVNLKRHKRTHTGEKPFLCPYPRCDNKFSQKVTLERHIRTHTGEKPYQCSLCNAKFLANSGLSRHIKTHSDERCHFRSSAMKKYYAKNTDVKPFQ